MLSLADYSCRKNFDNHRNFIPRPFTLAHAILSDHRLSPVRVATHQAQSTVTIILAHFFNPPASPVLESRIARISQISDRTRAVKYSQNSRRLKRPRAGILQNLFSRESTSGDGGDGDNGNSGAVHPDAREARADDWRRKRQRRAAGNRFFASDGAIATTPYNRERQNNLIMPWTMPNLTALTRTVDYRYAKRGRALMELTLVRLPLAYLLPRCSFLSPILPFLSGRFFHWTLNGPSIDLNVKIVPFVLTHSLLEFFL